MKHYSTSLDAPILASNTEIDWYGQSWTKRTFSNPERTINVATAFSGIGSPEMALEKLGVKHKILFACDIDKAAKKSYLANYNPEHFYDDIRELDARKYKGKVDLFVAGVCCQPWSLCGHLGGLRDDRGQLMKDFMRVICECQPKVWIFENVENIISHKDEYNGEIKRSWPLMLNLMQDMFKEYGIDYQLNWRILDAADYGIPQHRERVFMIGFLKPTDFKFPAPIKLEKKLGDFIDSTSTSHSGWKKLSSRERIRLMGFPDSFKQVVSDCQFSKQAGNSIVVDVMEALYRQIDITKYAA